MLSLFTFSKLSNTFHILHQASRTLLVYISVTFSFRKMKIFWLPVGCIWLPVGCIWLPVGCIWLPVGCLWLPVGCIWLPVGCIWLPVGCPECCRDLLTVDLALTDHFVRKPLFMFAITFHCSHNKSYQSQLFF